MGSPKALLPINGEPALIHVAKFFAFRFKLDVFATLPPSLLVDQELRMQAEIFGLQLGHNFYPELGYWGSIKTIVQEISPWADGLIINPIDAPGLSPKLVNMMLSLAKNNFNPKIIVPYIYCLAGHPVYLSAYFFADLCGTSYTSLVSVIKANHRSILRLYWQDSRILLNLNTRNQWHLLQLQCYQNCD